MLSKNLVKQTTPPSSRSNMQNSSKKKKKKKKNREQIHVKREIKLTHAVSILIGTVVGAGIFISPMGVYHHNESVGVSLVVWATSGLIAISGALCFAELGTSIARSGGEYAYAYAAFGHLPAFLVMWSNLIILRPTILSITALTFAKYATKPLFHHSEEPPWSAVALLAAASIALVGYVNCASVRWTLRFQNTLTVGKLIAVAIIIVTGLNHLCQGHTENFDKPFDGIYTTYGISMSFYSGMFAYVGFWLLNTVTEELIDPVKNLPRAIWISMPIITILYVLMNVSYFAVMTREEILQSHAVAVTFGAKMFGSLKWAIPVFVSLSCFGSLNGMLFTSGRFFMSGAIEGQLPSIMGTIHATRGTPTVSLIIVCAFSVVVLLLGDVDYLIDYFTHIQWLTLGVSVLGMLKLRRTQPRMERPIKVHLVFPIVFLGFTAFLVVVPLVVQPLKSAFGTALVLAGVPVYYACVRGRRCSRMENCVAGCNGVLQKIFRVVYVDLEVEKFSDKVY